ncbi:MAG: phenylalanine--tRNA ligase subunit beta [Nitrososphaerota archaeon]|nr:phenylalanine--tRNA ligase subunit beta [Aigarchaeota archaeon]MDW8077021.1 phenylalanine--tRNA ligase subunit beta [Nitrososphaerota archaeon]
MPILNLKLERFFKLLHQELDKDGLVEALTGIGVAIEELGADYVKVEYNPNRPDFSSPVGLARALKGILGIEVGIPKFRVLPPKTFVKVDRSVKSVRPWIVAAYVENLNLSAEDIEELIAMQEDLHWVVGRNRRKVAIGLHNASAIKPPIIYKAVKGDEISFVPLKDFKRMTPQEIVEKCEVGRKYGHIVAGTGLFPIIMDSRGEVLSLPPIINAALTELTEGTETLFIDVTGTDLEAVSGALNILTTALADIGGRIRQVRILYDDTKMITPDLRTKPWKLKLSYANELLGLNISMKDAVRALRKSRIGVKKVRGDTIFAEVPAYRLDIMHPVDLVEEIAMGLGYKNLPPVIPRTLVFGKHHPDTTFEDVCREIMFGLGFTEVVNFTLSNSTRDYLWMKIEPQDPVKILNPVSAEYDILRTWLIPGLLYNLAMNKHSPYPHRLFEIGDVLKVDESLDECVRRESRLAFVSSHADTSFSEVKSITEELLRSLGLREWALREVSHASFIDGRVAEVEVNGVKIGIMGEISPEVLEAFGITMPVSAVEIELQKVRALLSEL